MPANGKVDIGNPMPPESDANLTIEPYRHQLPSVTECPRLSTARQSTTLFYFTQFGGVKLGDVRIHFFG
jgi:hypothetical protein